MRATNESEPGPPQTGHRHQFRRSPNDRNVLMLAAPADDNQPVPHRYPVVIATVYPPAGQRSRAVWAVTCPWCGGQHLHTFSPETGGGGARRAGCRNAVYWLAVSHG